MYKNSYHHILIKKWMTKRFIRLLNSVVIVYGKYLRKAIGQEGLHTLTLCQGLQQILTKIASVSGDIERFHMRFIAVPYKDGVFSRIGSAWQYGMKTGQVLTIDDLFLFIGSNNPCR